MRSDNLYLAECPHCEAEHWLERYEQIRACEVCGHYLFTSEDLEDKRDVSCETVEGER